MADELNTDDLPKLTGKEELFVNFYFMLNCVGWKAAKEAGYQGNYNTLAVKAHNLLKKDNIAAHIRARMDTYAMAANEVLYHLGQIARGDADDLVDDLGNPDIKKARESGQTHLIKRIKSRTITTEDSDVTENEIEPYDRLKALELLGKHHKLFTERHELTGADGGAIEVKAVDYRLSLSALAPDNDE